MWDSLSNVLRCIFFGCMLYICLKSPFEWSPWYDLRGWLGVKQQLSIYLLNGQVNIFRLRTGHNRLNHGLHTEFGIGQTGECPCNMGQQTADHILSRHAQPTQLPETTSGCHPQAWRRNYSSLGDLRQGLHSSKRLGWTSEPGPRTKKNDLCCLCLCSSGFDEYLSVLV